MTHALKNYQTPVFSFFIAWIVFILIAGNALAETAPGKVICRVETDRAILPAGNSHLELEIAS
jgi:hypothetical protein